MMKKPQFLPGVEVEASQKYGYATTIIDASEARQYIALCIAHTMSMGFKRAAAISMVAFQIGYWSSFGSTDEMKRIAHLYFPIFATYGDE